MNDPDYNYETRATKDGRDGSVRDKLHETAEGARIRAFEMNGESDRSDSDLVYYVREFDD